MSQSVLMDHGARGARIVTEEELGDFPAPLPTATHFPIAHCSVLCRVEELLDAASFHVDRKTLMISHGGDRFFGTLDLSTSIANGVTLSVGIRSSYDKTFPIGACFGSRVFVCSNLAFHSEVTIARRHTRFGERRYIEATALALQGLRQFEAQESERISAMKERELGTAEADSLLLRAYETNLVSTPLLPKLIAEWREPSYEEFKPRTAWSLFNCFTHVLKDRQRSNPQRTALKTMQLHRFLSPIAVENNFAVSG